MVDTEVDKSSEQQQHQEIVGMLEVNKLNPYKITCIIDTSKIDPAKALGICEQFKDLVKSKIYGHIKEQRRIVEINNKGILKKFLSRK